MPVLLAAQFTVDGQLGSDPYGTPLAVQENTSQFGDNLDPDILAANGSELDALYARISGDRLHLLVTGNLETNFNKLNLFFDSRPGGQHSLLSGNPDIDLGSLNKLEGLTFDAGFEADFFLTVGGGNAGGSGITFFLNFAELHVDGANPGTGIYLGETGAGNTAFPVGLSDGVQVGINNSNTAGVMTGSAVGNPADVTTGIELSIPLALLGNPAGAIQVCAFIGSPDNAFLSNQVLGSLPPATLNLGQPAPVNFSSIAGDQFVTIPAPVDPVMNLNSGQSHTSLAAAVAAAAAGDTLTFVASLDGGAIVLPAQVLIDKSLSIDASGLPGGLALTAGAGARHMEIAPDCTVTLKGLTFIDGASTGNGGAILNRGTLTVEACLFRSNFATGNGGAIEGAGGSSTTIVACTFDGNTASDGGAIAHAGSASVTHSTFHSNTAAGYGGALFNFENSLTVEGSTFAANAAATGDDISLLSFGMPPTLTLINSIVAEVSEGEAPGSPASFTGTGNLIGGTPLLAPLGDYGGRTPTMPPLPGSPVIDAAVPAPVEWAVWTFETSQPGLDNSQALTGIVPESGPASASASGFHASSSTDYSNPVGNGSAESFSSDNWAVGDYYQFTVPGIDRGAFVLSFEHTSSGTGPAEFTLEYSVDGEDFSAFADYTVLQNGGWNNNPAPPDPYLPGYAFSFDLSGVTILNDQPLVHFRLTCRSDLAARGDTVGSGGTSRVDDVTVRAQVPDQRGLLRPNGPLPDIGAVEAYPFALLQLVSSDGDGIPDILKEAGAPYAHLDGINGSSVDTDGDGSSDAEEFANMTDLFDANDSFRVLAFDVDPAASSVVSITISTFPGLSYAFEAGNTLVEGDFPRIPDSQFKADDFEATVDLTLDPGSKRVFIRAKRIDGPF
jgi:predicted outer membrane repeat protein